MDNDKKILHEKEIKKKKFKATKVVTRGFILPQIGFIPPMPPVKPPRKD